MGDAFYAGEPWLTELEALMTPLINGYSVIAVYDTVGLWQHWPAVA